MNILGIDEATTHTRLYIDQVEFYYTSDRSPLFRIECVTSFLLCGQLQIDTRCQCQVVMTVTVITFLVAFVSLLPLIEGCCSISLNVYVIRLRSTCIGEPDITSQGTEIVHLTIDTKVVAVLIVGILYGFSVLNDCCRVASLSILLIQ